jgi:non-heme chloroperoxidase
VGPSWSIFVALVAALLAVVAMSSETQAAESGTDRYFVASDGVRLHYVESGSGRTIVFVPGWTMPAWIFTPQIRGLSSDFRIIAFDPRSQGASEIAATGHHPDRRAKDLAELIADLGDSTVVLVGWSLGVLDSLAYIRQHGDGKIGALVLIDNSIGEEPPPDSKFDFIGALKKNRTATTRSFVRAMYKRRQPDSYYERVVESSLRTPLSAAVELLSYPYPRTYWRDAIYSTQRPILYVVTPQWVGQGRNLSRKHPNARLEVFADAGHALFVDEADRFNRVLGDFMTNLQPSVK